MLPEQAPECLCSTKRWNSSGANIMPMLQSQWFTCSGCGRPAVSISSGIGHAFIIPTDAINEFPKDGMEWVNSALLVTWRDTQDRLNKARDAIEEASCKVFCEGEDLPRDSTMHDMNKDQRVRFQAMFDVLRNSENWISPEGFEEQRLPPQIPGCVTVFYPLGVGTWRVIKHAETTDLEIPTDPVRVRHDAYFNEVFSTLEGEFGQINRTEVHNQYCGLENVPWFTFSLGKCDFTVGPRKRVIAIKVGVSEGLDTKSIRDVALADETTYTADGAWQSSVDNAKVIEVHAWTKEKLIEYVTILGRAGIASTA